MSSLTGEQVFVGLDYHQSVVQVCVLDRDGKLLLNKRCGNNAGEIVRIVQRHGCVARAAVESCCGAANLAKELVERGWIVNLAHAGYVSRMKQNPDKTDYSDARVLADLVRVGYVPKVWLAPDEIVELRRLVRFRQELVDEQRNVKLRIRALLRDERLAAPEDQGRAWTQRWLKWLEAQLKPLATTGWILERQLGRLQDLQERIREVERRLTALVAEDGVVQKLQTLPGIGLITAVTIRAEVAQFDRFQSGKQLARFCGLSPRNASSGERQADAGLIRAGNPRLRAVLIEAAQRLLWLDARWQRLGHALLARGKPKSVVVAAVANRWVRWLYHQMQPEIAA